MGTQTDDGETTLSGELTHSLLNWPERELAAGLHPHLLGLLLGVYGVMLLTLWLFFAADINALIALGVCTVYFAMYFGVPLVMLRLAERSAAPSHPGSLRNFLNGDVETNTGRVSGWGAMAQLLTIPVGLTGAFIAFGIIIRLGA
jgi:hypothetical protein